MLEAQQALEVDLRPLVAAAAARSDLETVSVQVVNESGLNGLIGALCSTNPVTGTTYDAPLRDSGPVRNSTGSYPWRIDGDYTTLISITNVGDEPAQFVATINYQQEHYDLDPQELAVGETVVFDVKQIRDERIPARDGYRLPRRASVGQFRWSVMGGDGTARLIGRSEVVSASRRVSSTYSCPVCCPYSFNGISLNPGSFTTGPGSVTILVDGFEIDCYAHIIGPCPCYANECSSSNPSVLSAVIENGNIRADGVAPGQATITGYHQDMVYWDDGMDCYGFLMNFAGDCMGEVRACDPVITNFNYRGMEFTAPATITLTSEDCSGSQTTGVVARFVTRSGLEITQASCTAGGSGTNPEITEVGCGEPMLTGSGGSVLIGFRARKTSAAPGAGINVDVTVTCRGGQTGRAPSSFSLHCP